MNIYIQPPLKRDPDQVIIHVGTKICGDLKVIGMLMDMLPGFMKCWCFLCLWDSRATEKNYVESN